MGERSVAARTTGRLAKFAVATPTAAPTTEHRVAPDLKAFTLRQLRSAIRRNEVSFPSQTPLLTSRINPNQWRMAHLYFITGWSLRALGERYNLAFWWVGKLVHDWVERAIALGYVQEIPPEEPFQVAGGYKLQFELRRQPPARAAIVTLGSVSLDRSLQMTQCTPRPSRRSNSEVAAALERHRQGLNVEEICETVGITRRTFYTWKGKFGGLSESELEELRTLREENRILRSRCANAALLMARAVE
jgi:putative transposase